MRGKRISTDWHPRECAGKKVPDSCKVKRNFQNIVLIDVDSDNFPEVIIIDVPETLQEKLKGTGVLEENKKPPYEGVISIDDDNDGEANIPGPSLAGGVELDSDTTSSRRSSPSSDFAGDSVDSDADECFIVPEENFAFKSAKCKESCTGEVPCRNRYGFNDDMEDNSSDSDCSDCEVMEDSFGELREQWEKAFLKRKHDFSGRQFVSEDQIKVSHLHADACTSGVDGRNGIDSTNPVFSSTYHTKAKENLSTCDLNGVCGSFGVGNQRDRKADHESFSGLRSKSKEEFRSVPDNIGVERGEGWSTHIPDSRAKCQRYTNKTDIGSSFQDGPVSPLEPSSFCSETSASDERKFPMENRCNLDELMNDKIKEEEPSGKPAVGESCHADKIHVDHDTNQEVDCGKEKSPREKSDVRCTMSCDEKYTERGMERMCTVEKEEILPKSASSLQTSENRDRLSGLGCDYVSAVHKDVINGREMLKETDEYKRAVEEEWASRQRQLEIQAQEAQRLRKKRRAETMRLLDMEKRQKQRIEEMRRTQKKDEENMNLKEQLRAEIRKELLKLEMMCTDMASLLRGLGIHVGGSPFPSAHEVQAAYRRALLRFHPDRSSRSDMRQQVEAEEKFKLISRMKEKFLRT